MGKRRSSKSPGDAVRPLRRSPRIKLLPPVSYAEFEENAKRIKPVVLSYEETSKLDPTPVPLDSSDAEDFDSADIREVVSKIVINMEIDADTSFSEILNNDTEQMEGVIEVGPTNDQSKVSSTIQANEPQAVPPTEKSRKKKKGKQKKSGRVCPVCRKFTSTFLIWPCRHRGCKPCIENLRERSCPVCRGTLSSYLPTHLMGGEKWRKPNGAEALSPEERRKLITQIYERRAIISFAEQNGFHSLDLSVL